MPAKFLIALLLFIGQPTLLAVAEEPSDATTAAIELYKSQDYRAAFDAFSALSDDDPIAQYYLANMYAGGQGAEPDTEKALKWFIASAEQGHAKAQFKTGLAFNEGFGTKKDPAAAINWFIKAADQGIAGAQFYLAVAYQQGEYVKKDMLKAVKWMKQAAKHGISEAQTNLGNFYNEGIGVRQDNELAFAWYSIAALSGNEQAEQSQQVLVTKMTPEEVKEGEALAKKIYSRMTSSTH